MSPMHVDLSLGTACDECDEPHPVVMCQTCQILLCTHCVGFHRRSRRSRHHVLSDIPDLVSSTKFFEIAVQTDGPTVEEVDKMWRDKVQAVEAAKTEADARIVEITRSLNQEHKCVESLQQLLSEAKNKGQEEVAAAWHAAEQRISELKHSLDLEQKNVLFLQRQLSELRDKQLADLKEMAAVKKASQDLESEKAKVDRALEHEQRTLADLRQQYDGEQRLAQQETAHLRAAVQDKADALEQSAASVEALQQQQAALQAQLEDKALAIVSLEEEVETQKLILLGAQTQQKQHAELSEELNHKTDAIERLNCELEDKSKIIQDLKTKLAQQESIIMAAAAAPPPPPATSATCPSGGKGLFSPDMAPGMRRPARPRVEEPETPGGAPKDGVEFEEVAPGFVTTFAELRKKLTRKVKSPAEAALEEEASEWGDVVTEAEAVVNQLFDDAQSEASARGGEVGAGYDSEYSTTGSVRSLQSAFSSVSCVLSDAETAPFLSGGSRAEKETARRELAKGKVRRQGKDRHEYAGSKSTLPNYSAAGTCADAEKENACNGRMVNAALGEIPPKDTSKRRGLRAAPGLRDSMKMTGASLGSLAAGQMPPGLSRLALFVCCSKYGVRRAQVGASCTPLPLPRARCLRGQRGLTWWTSASPPRGAAYLYSHCVCTNAQRWWMPCAIKTGPTLPLLLGFSARSLRPRAHASA